MRFKSAACVCSWNPMEASRLDSLPVAAPLASVTVTLGFLARVNTMTLTMTRTSCQRRTRTCSLPTLCPTERQDSMTSRPQQHSRTGLASGAALCCVCAATTLVLLHWRPAHKAAPSTVLAPVAFLPVFIVWIWHHVEELQAIHAFEQFVSRPLASVST